jgi:hypothetical protein
LSAGNKTGLLLAERKCKEQVGGEGASTAGEEKSQEEEAGEREEKKFV